MPVGISSPAWLIAIGGNAADIILFFMFIGVFAVLRLVFTTLRDNKDEANKRYDELKQETIKHHDGLKASTAKRLKEVTHEVKQLDKLGIILSFIIHMKLGVKVIKHHHTGEHEIVNPILETAEEKGIG